MNTKNIGGKKFRIERSGFTLMELMIGIGLFTIALFGAMSVLSESLSFGKFSESRTLAMNEVRRVAEEIRRLADTGGLASVVNNNWAAWTAQNLSNTLDNETVMVTDFQDNPLQNNANPLPVRVRVNWTEKGKVTTYVVDTLVTKR